jgi:hypothetical protein
MFRALAKCRPLNYFCFALLFRDEVGVLCSHVALQILEGAIAAGAYSAPDAVLYLRDLASCCRSLAFGGCALTTLPIGTGALTSNLSVLLSYALSQTVSFGLAPIQGVTIRAVERLAVFSALGDDWGSKANSTPDAPRLLIVRNH